MSENAFCCKCRHYESVLLKERPGRCICPKNGTDYVVGGRLLMDPYVKNRDGNCPDFEAGKPTAYAAISCG